ncbi:MAG: NAD(P)-dependent oxidoreductase, partial [Brevibacterium sp.]|nr:NAD(P)-dependent oxidoreductase [Brevibacterium sp.]
RGHFAAGTGAEARAAAGGGACSRHLALNGVASVEACVGSGAISVFGAAQEMLIRVAAAETKSVSHRELKVMAPIGGDDRNDLRGGVETVSLSEVADAVIAVLSRPEDHEISTQLSV